MKVVIFCGGLGTRISQETFDKPKPMIKILGVPILERIINFYLKQNIDEIILLLGYKGNVIRKHFTNHKAKKKIKFINTGLKTLTGERLLKTKKYLRSEKYFMATYGDGLCDVNLKKVLKFHIKNKSIATITAVRPPARFGEIYFSKKDRVKSFKEKPNINSGWINGGFFILSKEIFNFLSKNQMLERQPMAKLVKKKKLFAYKHRGFWQCMDTKRDKDLLEKILKKKKI